MLAMATEVRRLRRWELTTSIPIGLGVGLAMALRMAREARKMEVGCMMDGLMGLEWWIIDENCI